MSDPLLNVNKAVAATQSTSAADAAQANAMSAEQAQAFLTLLEESMGAATPSVQPSIPLSGASGSAAAAGAPAENLSVQTAQWMAMYALENLPLPGMDNSQSTGAMDPLGISSAFPGNSQGLNSSPLSTLEQVLAQNLTPGASAAGTALPQFAASSATAGSNANLSATIDSAITQASAQYGVAPALIRAIITQESGGDPHAVSSAGAQGLMQLMPGTAAELGVSQPFDPVQNIMGGTQYLAQLLRMFSGNTQLAVAAYNAGPGAVQSYGGVPPYAETQHYVHNVMALMGSGSTSQA